MTIQQIYDKFATLQTSSDKLFFIDELRFLTNDKAIKRTKANNKIINLDTFTESLNNKKKLTFLIGDAGINDHYKPIECKTKHNLKYIINGLGGRINDKIIIIDKKYIYSYNLV